MKSSKIFLFAVLLSLAAGCGSGSSGSGSSGSGSSGSGSSGSGSSGSGSSGSGSSGSGSSGGGGGGGSITSVSGTYANGQPFTISGSAFGTNSASSIESLAAPIMSGTNGATFGRSNWSIDTEFGGNVTYTNSNTRGGTRTMALVAQDSGPYPETPLYYQLPASIGNGDHIFVSWWERTVWAGNGQYKIIRFSPTQTIVDGNGQDCYFFHNNGDGITFGPPDGTLQWLDFSPAEPQSTWTRTDIDMTLGNSNAPFTITKYTPGSAVQTFSATIGSYASSNQNYIVWQNYFGTDGEGTMTSGTVWLDSIFIQHGSRARVELCDTNTWAARKHCEIQSPISWSASTVQFSLDTGSLTGSTYVYVVDSNGNVSNGYQIH